MKNAYRFIVASILTFGTGALSFLFTSSQFPSWYEALQKPFFNPPAWMFAPVWAILYLLLAFTLVRIWNSKEGDARRRQLIVFFTQLLLTVLWSVLFFGLQSMTLSAVEIILLWFVVLILTLDTWGSDRTCFWLLAPYLAWITFAMLLNASIWWMN